MRIVFVGDLVGEAALDAIVQEVPRLREQYAPDFLLINAENAAGGLGLTPAQAQKLLGAGFDAITLGNHCWSRQAMLIKINEETRLIRPANGHSEWPGRGMTVLTQDEKKLAIVSVMGQVFMDAPHSPFEEMDRLVNLLHRQELHHIFVDFHAEATSEKSALGHYLDGRVSAVCGTHTHVQTADERVLPGGTAFITDVGMTGPSDSVIGMRVDASLRRLAKHLPTRYELASGPLALAAICLELDGNTGHCLTIERIARSLQAAGEGYKG